MGCDYYEKTYLLVIDGDNRLEIELSLKRYYFIEYNGHVDSDDTDYDDAVLKHYDKQLEVNFKPIILYKNGEFTKDNYREKYYYLLIENNICFNDSMIITKEKCKFLR